MAGKAFVVRVSDHHHFGERYKPSRYDLNCRCETETRVNETIEIIESRASTLAHIDDCVKNGSPLRRR